MATQALNRAAQKHTPDLSEWTKGQKVWLNAKNLTLPYGTIKVASRRHGPFIIEEVRSPVVYHLRLPPQWNILRSHIGAVVGLSNAPCCKVFV
jgi:hypothetical protein